MGNMTDYLEYGTAPVDEECVQVATGEEYIYIPKMKEQCNRFIALLRKIFGPEPSGAILTMRRFEHDFGPYYEVICSFDLENKAATDYAFKIEAYLPKKWTDERIENG